VLYGSKVTSERPVPFRGFLYVAVKDYKMSLAADGLVSSEWTGLGEAEQSSTIISQLFDSLCLKTKLLELEKL